MPSVSEEAKTYYKRFHVRTLTHPNPLVKNFANPLISGNPPRRLKRKWCRDLLAPNININLKKIYIIKITNESVTLNKVGCFPQKCHVLRINVIKDMMYFF